MCNVKVKVKKDASQYCVKMTDKATGAVTSFFSESFVSGINLAMSWMNVDVEFDTNDSVERISSTLEGAKDIFGNPCDITLGTKI